MILKPYFQNLHFLIVIPEVNIYLLYLFTAILSCFCLRSPAKIEEQRTPVAYHATYLLQRQKNCAVLAIVQQFLINNCTVFQNNIPEESPS
jgi:hypothetical protein